MTETSGSDDHRIPPRLVRERKTIRAMIEIACRGRHHSPAGLCTDCTALLEYALQRIDACPYGEQKPTCVRCPIHCYRKDRREEVRAVMRFAGPRMLLRHPFLTFMHFVDKRRDAPALPSRKSEKSSTPLT